MPATRLATQRVEKPWGRHHLWPGFADPAPDAAPVGEVWFQAEGDTRSELLVKYLFTSERRKDNPDVAIVRLEQIYPFPSDLLGEILARYDKVLVPEMNLGQLALLLRARYLVDAIGYNHVRGLPLRSHDIARRIGELIADNDGIEVDLTGVVDPVKGGN